MLDFSYLHIYIFVIVLLQIPNPPAQLGCKRKLPTRKERSLSITDKEADVRAKRTRSSHETTPVTSLATEDDRTLENETTIKVEESSSETSTYAMVGKGSSEVSTSNCLVNTGINQKLNSPIDSALKIRLKQKIQNRLIDSPLKIQCMQTIQQLQSRRWSLEKASTSAMVEKDSSEVSTSATVGKGLSETATYAMVGADSSEASNCLVNTGINQKLNRPIDSALKIRLKQKIQQLQCGSLEKASNSLIAGKGSLEGSTAVTVEKGSSEVSTSATVGNGSSEVSTSATVGNGSSEVSTSATVGKDSSEVSTSVTVGKGSSEVSHSVTVGKGSSEVSNSVTVGKDSSEVSDSVTVGKGSSELSNSVTVGNGSSVAFASVTVGKGSEVFNSVVNTGTNGQLNKPKYSQLEIQLKKKVQQLQSRCWKLEKTVKKLRLKIPPKVSESVIQLGAVDAIVRDAKQFLTPFQLALFKSQMLASERKKRGYRWSVEEKLFALQLYRKSAAAYIFVSQHFALPTLSTLRSFEGAASIKMSTDQEMLEEPETESDDIVRIASLEDNNSLDMV